MKYKLFLSSLFSLRNIGVLLLTLGLLGFERSGILFSPFLPYPEIMVPVLSFGVYMAFVVQSVTSKEFHEKYNRKQKIRRIQDLNYMCLKLYAEAKKHTNTTYMQKLKKVMDDKNHIVNSFFRGEKSYLKERIVEQTLNLVVSYIRLLTNFCIRSRELSEVDMGEITNRINTNLRKINFINDPNILDDLKKVIEMDEKLIKRLKEEKKELERISAKLDYMESTVHMFKHQTISSLESEEMLEKLETAVNEAAALDSVLEERRRNKLRL